MHTFLSHAAQPYPTADYPIFVAEVASTFNENLLIHIMLDRAKDDATRLFLLGTLLDGLRTTLFRQTQFAEFELAFHEQAERGEPLTGENLSKLYLKIARDYYGHDKRVCQVDDLFAIEWAYVPHFYYNFYVYQYATSMVASTSLARGGARGSQDGQDHAPRRFPEDAVGRQLAVRHRPAQDRRRRHDDVGAVRRSDRRDERHHGRDGADPRPPEEARSER